EEACTVMRPWAITTGRRSDRPTVRDLLAVPPRYPPAAPTPRIRPEVVAASTLLRESREDYEVERRRRHPGLREEPEHLPAMVRLVVEDVTEHEAHRDLLRLALQRPVLEHTVEPVRIDAGDHPDDVLVVLEPRGAQVGEVVVEDLVERKRRRLAPLEARAPHP